MDAAELQKAINESGFPLQFGIEQLVYRAGAWKTILSEHPWIDPLNSDEKFIDLVLQQGQDYPVRLVVECKRARDTEWLFLRSPTSYPGRDERLHTKSRVFVRQGGGNIDQWLSLPFRPGSPEAGYCVVRRNGQRSQELLERTAAELVRATESLAQQEVAICGRSGRTLADPDRSLKRIYIPVVITTATMSICDADYAKLDLASGEVRDAVSLESPVIRFVKSLAALDPNRSNATTIEEFSTQSERSVVVVQATHFLDFLQNLELSKQTNADLLKALL